LKLPSLLLPSVTVEILKSTMVEKLPNDLEGMESSMGKLYILIDEIYKYVDDVVVSISPVTISYFVWMRVSTVSV
jgi:hypothetical protein